jgi:curved DNA-binding protein CbpA
MTTHYDTLGIEQNADEETIKKVYRRLAKKYHSDKNDCDDEVMKNVNVAYEILSDPEKRAAYDKSLRLAAVQIVTNLAMQWLSVVDNQGDMLTFIREQLYAQLQGIANRKQGGEKIIAHLKRNLKKLKFKGKVGEDMIGELIQQQIVGIEKQMADSEKETIRINDALKYVDNYSFEQEAYITAFHQSVRVFLGPVYSP